MSKPAKLLRVFLSAIILIGTAGPALAGEWRLSLDEAVERALAENRDIKIAKERLVELHGLKGEVRSIGLPQLTATGQYQRMWNNPEMTISGQIFKIGTANTYTAEASVSQLLFDGGKIFRAIKAAKIEETRGIETVKDAEAQVKLGTRETFHEILYMDKLIDVLTREHKQLSEHLMSIKARFAKGLESDYALMRQEVQAANIEPQIIDAKRNKELLANAMKVLLAIPQEDSFIASGEFNYKTRALPDIGALSGAAVENRPDLAAEKLRAKSLALNVGIEKSGYVPTLNFNSAYQWQGLSENWSLNDSGESNSLATTLSLSWPIFDGLKTYSRVRQAKARHVQQIYTASIKEDNVIKEVRNVYEILMRSREALASQQKYLKTARRASQIAGERFEAGLMSQLELNDTITSQAVAEQNYLRAALDCLNAEAALEKAVGGEL